MTRSVLLLLSVAAVAFSGCVYDGTPPSAREPERGATSEEAPGEGPATTPTVVHWDGYTVVGAAANIPAHWDPPEEHVEPIMKEGFYLDVLGDTEALEFHLTWTGSPGTRIVFMAHSPHGHGERMREYQVGEYAGPLLYGSTQQEQCFRIPPSHLPAIPDGFWMPMFHTMPFGAQVDANITVTAIGGTLEIIKDEYHGHDPSNPEEIYGPFLASIEPDPILPCDGPLGSR